MVTNWSLYLWRFFNYTHLENTKPIIELAQEIVANVSMEDLENDIGWVTENLFVNLRYLWLNLGKNLKQDKLIRSYFEVTMI